MNKVKQSLAADYIPEPRKRRFVSAVAKRAKQREFAKAQSKRRRKAKAQSKRRRKAGRK